VAVLFGLLAALGWGIGDFLVRFAGRGEGVFRTMLYGQIVGLGVLTIWLAADGAATLSHMRGAGWLAWAAALLAVPANLSATYALFRALTRGTIALVSPICASYGAVTALLSVLAGEPIGRVTGAGMGFAVLGLALASAGGGRDGQVRARGLGFAAYAAAGYGAGFWLQGRFAVASLGALLPVWLYYALGVAALIGIGAASGQNLAPPGPGRRWLLAGYGGLGVFSYIVFTAGLGTGQVATVTVLSSLASGITTLLARVLLHERLERRQWTGIVAILAGIALIDAGR
jgi:drug/metabolite transporter (DMT)-like permease